MESERHLEPSQTLTMELFWKKKKKRQLLKAIS